MGRHHTASVVPAPVAEVLPTFAPGRYVDLPGRGRTFVREVEGPPGAPVLILLHGWTATGGTNFAPVMAPDGAPWRNEVSARLAGKYRMLAMDLRGHGRGMRTDNFTIADCAGDVVALMDALGVERATMAGYSMGGAVALDVYDQAPERVEGLIFCSTAAAFATRLTALLPAGAGAKLLARPGAALFRTALFPELRHIPFARMTDDLRRSDLLSLVQAGPELMKFNARDRLARIDVPTAVVVTDLDQLVPKSRQVQLVERIRGATRYDLLLGDHFAAGLRPGAWSRLFEAAADDVVARAHRLELRRRAARGTAAVIPFPGRTSRAARLLLRPNRPALETPRIERGESLGGVAI